MRLSRLADITLICVAFIWGATFVVVQSAIEFLPPFMFNGIRFLLAALPLVVVLALKRTPIIKRSIWYGVILGSFLFIGYAFQTLGLLFTTPSKAGFVTGLSVVMVPLFLFIFFKSHPSKGAITGSILAAIGLYLLMAGHSQAFNIGDALVFICAFGFALHIIYTDYFTKKASLLLLTTVQLCTVGILSMGCAFIWEHPKVVLNNGALANKEVITALLITSLLATLLAFITQTFAQRYTTPSKVAIIFTLEPVFAAFCSYLWIDERLGALAITGSGLIVIGMLFSELPIFAWMLRKMNRDHSVEVK
ncbi:DMT family transporter [Rossellomorea aquimaris]|uniref:DMT family transporter n=1 Tax=Rossellomorea aquimaris TaxID=189382 RepID=UPI001CD229B9|nr:DMT family transporter [Rossellomorea aquimaris]MCA1058400.1 DMT family transporter [Rossellomorea aquimaris]